MAIPLNDNIDVQASKPQNPRSFHPSNRPWSSITEAHNGITFKHVGLQVVVADGQGGFDTYVYKDAFANESDLVLFASGGGSMTDAEVKTAYENNPDTNAFTDAEQLKLGGIANAATANSTDAQLRDRSTHTGTQTASTISDFDTAVSNNPTVQSKEDSGSNIEISTSRNFLANDNNSVLVITNTNVVLTLDNFTGFANNFRCSILVLVGFSATVTVVPPLILEDTTGESGLISQDNQRSLFRIGNKLYII